MLVIDGSMGEGGGQVLRTSLALSLLAGTPFHIEKIRANRPKPGLAPQHLASVEAAAAVGSARVEGAARGSTALTFEPGVVQPGVYRFDVGTAGSTSLVLQTVALPLALAPAESSLTVTGGTHVPWSPSFHYLDRRWCPVLADMGLRVEVALGRAGFYPRGGGMLEARLGPGHGAPRPLRLGDRGRLLGVKGLSVVAGLPASIAERQARRASDRLVPLGVPVEIATEVLEAPSPGTFLFLEALFERSRCCATGLGARGKPAERVADEAVDEVEAYRRSGAALDEHLADQILLSLALADGESSFTVVRVTRHLTTNAKVIRLFCPGVRLAVEGAEGSSGRVAVQGCPR